MSSRPSSLHSDRNYISFIVGITAGLTLLTVISIYSLGKGEEGIRFLIRYSARASALLFSLAFSISAIHFFLRNYTTAWLLNRRPYMGLIFGVMHTFHLMFLIYLQQAIHPVFTMAKNFSLFAGGMAYLFMYIMVITTFPSVKRHLTMDLWRKIHLIGAYWIWAIFFNSYLKRVMNLQENYILFSILVSVLLLRLVHRWIVHRQSKSLLLK